MSVRPDYRPALRAELSRQRRALCEHSLAMFARTYLGHHFRLPPSRMHRELFERLGAAPGERPCRIAVAAPRGHAKTTVTSLAFVLWCLVYRKEVFVLLVSATREQAAALLKPLKQELESNGPLIEDFPEATVPPERRPRVSPWKENQIVLPNGAAVRALGAEQRMRGMKHRQHRPSLIVVDDLEDQEHVASAQRRASLRVWFEGTLLKMCEPASNVVTVGTILHYDSLLAHLVGARTAIGASAASGWEGSLYQAVEAFSTHPELWDRWESIFVAGEDYQGDTGLAAAQAFLAAHRAAMHEGTAVLWPELDDYQRLMVMRAREGRASFQAEKQNEPLDPEKCLFRQDHFCFWDDQYSDAQSLLAALGPDVRFFGACDPSLGRRGGDGDYSAIITLVEHRPTKIYYVILADLARRTPDQTIQKIVELGRLYRYRDFAVESNGFQQLMVRQLKDRAENAGVDLYVKEVQHSSDKAGRIESLEPLIATGRLRLSRRHGTLLDQLRQFPLGAHDDGPDALEMAVAAAMKGGGEVGRVWF